MKKSENLGAAYIAVQEKNQNTRSQRVSNYYSSFIPGEFMIADLRQIAKVITKGIGLDRGTFDVMSPIYVPISSTLLQEINQKFEKTIHPSRVVVRYGSRLLVVPRIKLQVSLSSIDQCLDLMNELEMTNLVVTDDPLDELEIMVKVFHLFTCVYRQCHGLDWNVDSSRPDTERPHP